jgi:hypothetical protein
MKAVFARSLDPGRIVELAHDLPAHNVEEAAFVVRAMGIGFPSGTVHVVVVDPGVGGRRAPIAIACRDGSRLVGPNNGVLYPLARSLGIGPAYRIEPVRLRPDRPRVGTTFDGRDLFAPAAAALAAGRSPRSLGTPMSPRRLEIPVARRTPAGSSGEIVHVDHFGNLISNVPAEWVPRRIRTLEVRVGSARSRSLPWRTSYEALGVRRAGVLGSSFGTIEVAVAQGRAADRFHARVGSSVRIRWGPGAAATVSG